MLRDPHGGFAVVVVVRAGSLTLHSGLIAHGDIPPEFERYDNPALQQKMKPRHIQMIAVGGE